MLARPAFLGALLALLIAAPAAAQRPRLTDFDVAQSQTWAEALALCDMTAFLRTRPSLNADVIMAAPGVSHWYTPLYGPRFLPPGLIFDSGVKRSFDRLEKAGELDRKSFRQARARHDVELFRTYERAGPAELKFLEEQSELCAALTYDIMARYPA